jgi:hypothetical protein
MLRKIMARDCNAGMRKCEPIPDLNGHRTVYSSLIPSGTQQGASTCVSRQVPSVARTAFRAVDTSLRKPHRISSPNTRQTGARISKFLKEPEKCDVA